MALVDDRVLEYLRENGSGSPTEMKEEGPIRYSSQYIGRRCKKLKENGLVQHLGNGVYIITDDGEAYLDGQLDTQEWNYIDEDAGEVTANNSEEVPGESNGGAT